MWPSFTSGMKPPSTRILRVLHSYLLIHRRLTHFLTFWIVRRCLKKHRKKSQLWKRQNQKATMWRSCYSPRTILFLKTRTPASSTLQTSLVSSKWTSLRSKTTFLNLLTANVSHEMDSPLNCINVFSEKIILTSKNETHRSYALIMKNSASLIKF